MRRRHLLGAAGLLALAPAWAQTDWRVRPVPAYAGQDVVAGALRQAYLPWAGAFESACAALVRTLADDDTGTVAPREPHAARQAWTDALLAWARLSAVAVGPLVTRRSARRIDFHPTRPEQILKAIARAPSDEAAMERIGSAAKGFAALEWLLWDAQAPTDAPARAYRQALAEDLRREAVALVLGFRALVEAAPDEAATSALLVEWINQWLGGIEQLRLQGLVRPVQEARTRDRSAPLFARAASGADAGERLARWQAISAFGRYGDTSLPVPGEGLVPLETWLRAKGLNPLADGLRERLQAATDALERSRDDQPEHLTSAAARLAELGHWVQEQVTPRLDIRIGFSDADGD